MRQEINAENIVDENGNGTGGSAIGIGINIRFQNGPLGPGPNFAKQNGAFVEGVIEAALQRLEFFQTTRFLCRENDLAIIKLQEALHWLDHRTNRRKSQGTEGTYNAA